MHLISSELIELTLESLDVDTTSCLESTALGDPELWNMGPWQYMYVIIICINRMSP